MKKFALKSLLSLSVLFMTLAVNAQKNLSEGSLTYNISIESTNGEKAVAGSLNGAVLTVYLTKDKSRTEMTSTPGTETMVFDTKAGKGFILKEYSGQKLMITVSENNRKDKMKVSDGLSFSTVGGTTVINGYTCTKATATGADGKNYTVFYDPTVNVINKTYNNAFPQLKGLPVQYEFQSGNLVFRYTLVKYSTETIADNRFDSPKGGFRVMSYEENQQLKKGN